LAICYDLRFPELFRHYAPREPIVLHSSNFTQRTGKDHGKSCSGRRHREPCFVVRRSMRSESAHGNREPRSQHDRRPVGRCPSDTKKRRNRNRRARHARFDNTGAAFRRYRIENSDAARPAPTHAFLSEPRRSAGLRARDRPIFVAGTPNPRYPAGVPRYGHRSPGYVP